MRTATIIPTTNVMWVAIPTRVSLYRDTCVSINRAKIYYEQHSLQGPQRRWLHVACSNHSLTDWINSRFLFLFYRAWSKMPIYYYQPSALEDLPAAPYITCDIYGHISQHLFTAAHQRPDWQPHSRWYKSNRISNAFLDAEMPILICIHYIHSM